jgi:hypothetical protein
MVEGAAVVEGAAADVSKDTSEVVVLANATLREAFCSAVQYRRLTLQQ